METAAACRGRPGPLRTGVLWTRRQYVFGLLIRQDKKQMFVNWFHHWTRNPRLPLNITSFSELLSEEIITVNSRTSGIEFNTFSIDFSNQTLPLTGGRAEVSLLVVMRRSVCSFFFCFMSLQNWITSSFRTANWKCRLGLSHWTSFLFYILTFYRKNIWNDSFKVDTSVSHQKTRLRSYLNSWNLWWVFLNYFFTHLN